MNEEENRLDEARKNLAPWRMWGPYLSERQWGTVREDYSSNGTAWEYFDHDAARSRAYRWGEDGIAGISDDRQRLCFALAFWNGKDPILKERLFGLTGNQGNHGEDVKEYAFYLDNTPTHAYMKYLYKYPHNAYPYEDLVKTNRARSRKDFEYELLDTGIFEGDRYFDIFVEYAKASPEDLLIRITIENRGSDKALLHVLPTLWFRNTWSWAEEGEKPYMHEEKGSIKAVHSALGVYRLEFDPSESLLFTENETNKKRLFNQPNGSLYVKDAFHEYVVFGNKEAINPSKQGTKASPHYRIEIDGKSSSVIKLRLSRDGASKGSLGLDFDNFFKTRKDEADAFYYDVTPFPIPDDMRSVQRQAFAGLLWNKQYYHYNVRTWLAGDPSEPKPPPERLQGRNHEWKMLDASDIFSMPDKWEYPWFASWDLAFHALTFAMIDPDFAKHQLTLLAKEWYMHPNGQIPAYEWAFGDVNPPVHAWAALRIYQIEASRKGRKDRDFLEQMFHKLSLNFTWWVNRKDAGDRNIFEGGFLGLDNIGVFDRTMGSPVGGVLYQTDGTGWMAMYALNLLQIALELAIEDPVYEHMATKFFEHFIFIADAMNSMAGEVDGLWDEERGFYHGLLVLPDGQKIRMAADTLVGVIPVNAVATSNAASSYPFTGYRKRFQWFIDHRPDMIEKIVNLESFREDKPILLSLVSPDKLRCILEKVLDSEKLLSPFGLRSVSKELKDHPCVLELGGKKYSLDYEPAESTTTLFGGNSNWRGPVWFPLNYLFIESLQKYHYYLGDEFKIEHPAKSGRYLSIWNITLDLSHRLIKIFLKDEKGRRPVYGGIEKFQTDPHWKDLIQFHEYFHGDNGAGLGASNQTGWTALVAKLIDQYARYSLQKRPPERIEDSKLGNL